MSVPFSNLPGRHERHYRRRLLNPLFGASMLQADDDMLLEQQRLDHKELITFVDTLRGIVRRAVELKPNEESDVILRLKEDLDRLYETSAGLAEDQEANQAAIRQLLEVIMRTVRAAAMGDPKAQEELEQEELARATHFDLLRYPLVADLLHPETVIETAELVPTLLSDEADALAAALTLFEQEQLSQILADAERLLSATDPEKAMDAAWARCDQLRGFIANTRTAH